MDFSTPFPLILLFVTGLITGKQSEIPNQNSARTNGSTKASPSFKSNQNKTQTVSGLSKPRKEKSGNSSAPEHLHMQAKESRYKKKENKKELSPEETKKAEKAEKRGRSEDEAPADHKKHMEGSNTRQENAFSHSAKKKPPAQQHKRGPIADKSHFKNAHENEKPKQ